MSYLNFLFDFFGSILSLLELLIQYIFEKEKFEINYPKISLTLLTMFADVIILFQR